MFDLFSEISMFEIFSINKIIVNHYKFLHITYKNNKHKIFILLSTYNS